MNKGTRERLRHPREFRKWYHIPTDDGPRPWASVADPQQVKDHDAMIPAILRVMGEPSEGGLNYAYLERCRVGSKTTDSGMDAANLLYGSRRKLRLKAYAEDKEQATLLRDALSDGISYTPGLDRILEVQQYRVWNRRTESALTIEASHVASSWGPTPAAVFVDELTHWSNRKLWDSIISSAGKSRNCMVIVGSNAGLGRGTSWHWRIREACRTAPDWYFSRMAHVPARMTEARLESQRRMLTRGSFRRLWENEWLTEAGDALTEEEIQDAITLSGPALGREEGYIYGAGLDLALKRDHSALVVVGVQPGSGRVKLVQCRSWKPRPGIPINLNHVEAAVVQAHETFQLVGVVYDPTQMGQMQLNLRMAGIRMHQQGFARTDTDAMARAVVEVFTNRQIDIYPEPALIHDLHALCIMPKPWGYKLEAPSDPELGHADRAIALALILPSAIEWSWDKPSYQEQPLTVILTEDDPRGQYVTDWPGDDPSWQLVPKPR